jgi:hypothetical protein
MHRAVGLPNTVRLPVVVSKGHNSSLAWSRLAGGMSPK